MTIENPKCPNCQSENAYQDGTLWICPDCFHEWSADATASAEASEGDASPAFVDVNGAPLQDGDTVTTVKDLKAGKVTIKAGTKVKGIRLLDSPVNGHDISCKIPGHGAMYLKCSVVKKA